MLRYAYYPCLITAETEPPGRLHSSTGSPYEPCQTRRLRDLDSGHQLIQITLGPFQLQAGRFSSLSSWSVSLGLAAPEHRMSLSTLVLFADVAQRQTRYACNPWLIQAEPEPPGRLPPAPGSHIRRANPLPRALS